MTKREQRVSIDSACVQTSISSMQAAIRQCIQNSMAYKQWCITIFAGLLVVSLVSNSDAILLIAMSVVGIFYLLDSANASIRLRLQDEYDRSPGSEPPWMWEIHHIKLLSWRTPRAAFCPPIGVAGHGCSAFASAG